MSILKFFRRIFRRTRNQLASTYWEYPSKFWILVGASFIDRLGGTMLFPFFALYITARFNVGMTEAGILLGIFSACGAISGMFGGALTDKIGRKKILLLGLILSALSSIVMGLITEFSAFYIVVIFVGLLSSIGFPAQQAIVADIVSEEKRTGAFGVMRVVMNMAWVVGPTVGGLLASQNYMNVFIADAVTSTITAFIVFRKIRETKPQKVEQDQTEESLLQTFTGYGKAIGDGTFISFLLVSILMLVVYNQLYNTLSVYLRDVHGVPAAGYGKLMSINASAVVILQFWISRRVSQRPPLVMMALGAGLYMIGFTLYGFVNTFFLFTLAMLIITFGEMVVMPVSQAFVAKLAPADMRGRYMAVFGLSWHLPAMVGPALAGIILDNYNPDWIWYGGGIIAAISVAGFLLLHLITYSRLKPTEEPEPSLSK